MSSHFSTQSLGSTFVSAVEVEEHQLILHMVKKGLKYGDQVKNETFQV